MMRRQQVIHFLSKCLAHSAICFLPIMPVVLSLVLMDLKYVRQYPVWLRRLKLHFSELSKGPIEHFLSDVLMQHRQIPVHVQGECVQCGNCCLNKKCAFLVETIDEKFQCSIYTSRLRKFSNCSSFPLHANDIARYECPGYEVVPTFKVVFLNGDGDDKLLNKETQYFSGTYMSAGTGWRL